MTQFNDRERAYESKFAHDQEMEFKIAMQRDRMVGQWAAEKLGLTGDEAAAYVRTVIEADFERPGPDDVLEKIQRDFEAHKVAVSARDLKQKLEQFEENARRAVKVAAPQK